MNKETTLLDKLILSEMTSSRIAGRKSKKRLIREAGEDPNAMGGAPADPNADPMGGAGAPADPSMGGDPNAMGGAPADPSMGGDPNAMGGAPADPSMGGDPNADPMGGAGAPADPSMSDPMGGAPMDPMGGIGADPMGGDPNADPNAEQDDEATLNIDDLTNSQEKMNNKINTIGKNQIKTDDRIEKLLQAVSQLKSTIDSNNKEIERLQKDVIKRNPTPTENLYIQSLDSYPYNTNISAYWKDYTDNARENYNVIAGGYPTGTRPDGGQHIDGSNEDRVYEITADDLDDFNADDVYDSFSIGNDEEESHNAFRPRF